MPPGFRILLTMSPVTPQQTAYARGYPSALNELRLVPTPAEPDVVWGLYALLQSAGMSISYSEVDVLSGHATQFLYSREQPECAQLAFVPPVDTLLRALDVTWKEVTPSGPVTAFHVVKQWLEAEYVVLARLKEPLLIFGYTQAGPEHFWRAVRIAAGLQEEQFSIEAIDRGYWRYPLDEGNTLIRIEAAPRRIETLTEHVRVAARRAVRAWHTSDLAGCWSGDEAYRRVTADLADPTVEFHTEPTLLWTGHALWKQWTSRVNLHLFFDRAAPRFGGQDRKAVEHAAFCYGRCVEAWKQWAAILGPARPREREGFQEELTTEFLARWTKMELRMKAAHVVNEARDWEEKAITELTHIIR
jgi:hypothetical protein